MRHCLRPRSNVPLRRMRERLERDDHDKLVQMDERSDSIVGGGPGQTPAHVGCIVCAVVCVCSVVWKRAIYVRHFLGFVEALPNIAIPHVVDNSALPALTENMGVSRKTEHFRRWQHFIGVTL
jgi:hypothetical protein